MAAGMFIKLSYRARPHWCAPEQTLNDLFVLCLRPIYRKLAAEMSSETALRGTYSVNNATLLSQLKSQTANVPYLSPCLN